MFQHTAARRRLLSDKYPLTAGEKFQHTAARRRLLFLVMLFGRKKSFNTQPPEGGCTVHTGRAGNRKVSTHSRPKAAGQRLGILQSQHERFNTQPPEGGCNDFTFCRCRYCVSTHSRPKAAAKNTARRNTRRSFNTQPPEGGCRVNRKGQVISPFQHTAARRRLASDIGVCSKPLEFQHTAARRRLTIYSWQVRSQCGFQHTAARRRLQVFQKQRLHHW